MEKQTHARKDGEAGCVETGERDIHNCFTQSISPQPKKRKHKEKDYEEMEAMNFKETVFKDNDLTKEGEVFWIDARNVNDKENDALCLSAIS